MNLGRTRFPVKRVEVRTGSSVLGRFSGPAHPTLFGQLERIVALIGLDCPERSIPKLHQAGWVVLRGRRWYGYYRKRVLNPTTNEEQEDTVCILLELKSRMTKAEARNALEFLKALIVMPDGFFFVDTLIALQSQYRNAIST